MEPKIIILDVGKHLDEFRKQYAVNSPYLFDQPQNICSALVECAINRTVPHASLLNYVGKIKHGQSYKMPPKQSEKFSMAVGDLGMRMIDSMKRLGFGYPELAEEEKLPYHFYRACKNIVVLRHNGADEEAA